MTYFASCFLFTHVWIHVINVCMYVLMYACVGMYV